MGDENLVTNLALASPAGQHNDMQDTSAQHTACC